LTGKDRTARAGDDTETDDPTGSYRRTEQENEVKNLTVMPKSKTVNTQI
jgi:hypothetical protein